MLSSVQNYAKGIVDGLIMPPGVPGPMVARVTAPAVEKMKEPRAYVWGGRLAARRQSAPRGAGFMKFLWVIDIYVAFLDTPDDAFQNEPFPLVLDAVMKAFMTATMPVLIDPLGNVLTAASGSASDTQIQAVGEQFDLEYPPERTVNALRQAWYSARIGDRKSVV